ncbi:F-box protein At3g07870 [Eucalyptus grandis]|uniref:F-box protein At3g07870 n=1 Tax=Eucalyptus grandis TaxID=71139 RepID=UPI00192EAC5E|nr:F-box protein At3g07870 [Eucalyptus grandis]
MHMGVSRCFPWRSRTSNGKKRDGFGTLPDNVVVDVLSRLEVDQLKCAIRVCRRWHALIATAHFARLHLQRVSSVTVVYPLCFEDPVYYNVGLFFIDWGSMEKKPIAGAKSPPALRDITVDRSCHLLGCCDGLFILIKTRTASMYEIHNPVTWERVPVPHKGSICGFFLHPLSNKYRLLSYRETPNGFWYQVDGLGPAACIDVGMFRYRPREQEAPSGVRGRLHWMVVGKEGVSPPCSHSIMVFSARENAFCFMPHPGDSCLPSKGHSNMHLVEMQGRVYVYAIQVKFMSIWVLEDHASWQWVKKCDINLQWNLNRHPVHDENVTSYENYKNMQLIDIRDGELLLFWPGRGLFQHNLQSQTIKRVPWPFMDGFGYDTYRMKTRVVMVSPEQDFKRLHPSGRVPLQGGSESLYGVYILGSSPEKLPRNKPGEGNEDNPGETKPLGVGRASPRAQVGPEQVLKLLPPE